MIAVQESFGQVLIPYAINISQTFFDIFNGLGIVFVPFTCAIITAVVKSVVQGLDEGSPAVMAIKLYEKSFYSMLAVLILFVIPVDTKENEVSYQSYVCGVEGESTALGALYRFQPQLKLAANQIQTRAPQLPVGMGLANNITVGSAESMSARLPCSPRFETLEAKLAQDYIQIKDEALVANLKQFNDQCYKQAVDRISKSHSANRSTLPEPFSREANFFFGLNATRAYEGFVTSDPQSSLMFRIKDSEFTGPVRNEYKPENYDENPGFFSGKTNRLAMSCSDAALEYRHLLNVYAEQHHREDLERIYASISLLPQADQKGNPSNITRSAVKDAFIQQAMLDVVSGKRGLLENTPSVASAYNETWYQSLIGLSIDNVTSLLDEGETKSKLGASIANVGMGLENIRKNAERVNLYVIAPLIVTIVLAAVYIASPILIVLSGYSWSMVFNQVFILFYLAMTSYIVNVSFIFTNTIQLFAESYYGTGWSHTDQVRPLDYVATMLPFFAIITWTGICLIAGLKLGPFLAGFFTGTATAAGKAGARATEGALSGGTSKAVGGSKRQMGNNQ